MAWARRGLLIFAAIAAAAVVAFFVFQRQIAAIAFERAIATNLGRDLTATLPDGLHVFMCGAGSPMPDPHRGGPCVGVVAGTRVFVFDAGSGGARTLGRMGFPLARLDRIYLTHLHSDHIDGLGEMLLQAWIGGNRKVPVPVAGPIGTRRVVEGFNIAYEIDSGYRLAHHGPDIADLAGFGAVPEQIDLRLAPDMLTGAGEEASKVVFQEGGVRITAIPVTHAPVHPAFGFRIDYKDRSVTLSGDTVYDARFVEASKGVDVMLHEALSVPMVRAMSEAAATRGLPHISKIMTDILDYHASPEDAARAAADAGVDQLVLYHIVPPLPSALLKPVFLGTAARNFPGNITIAQDGLVVSLPSGSDDVSRTRAF